MILLLTIVTWFLAGATAVYIFLVHELDSTGYITDTDVGYSIVIFTFGYISAGFALLLYFDNKAGHTKRGDWIIYRRKK